MVPGMIFTIEPMVNMGRVEIYVDEANDWTVYTEDGKPSAQSQAVHAGHARPGAGHTCYQAAV